MDKKSKAYKKAISEANRVYGTKSSIYRSSFIVQKYKEFGGSYTKKRDNINDEKLTRWYKEQWISLVPYLEQGKIVKCGAKGSNNGGCRPLKRVSNDTPITIGELLEIHKKRDILKLARLKKENPDIRVNWKKLTYS